MAKPLLKTAEMPTKVDPVTFEVLRNLFEYTCERMTTILQKASFSPILADMLDFSNAIYDPELSLLSQAANCPVHLAAMQFSAREAVKRFGIENLKEGEIFVLNDPYAAVRFIAYRSLRSLPGFGAFDYDFLENPKQRIELERKVLDTWRVARPLADRRNDVQLLLDPEGTFKTDVVARLMRERNNRPLHLRE